MGGNALKNTVTRRHDKDEFDAKTIKIISRLNQYGHFYRKDVIQAYREKDTFGDLDILYSTFDDRCLDVDSVKQMFPESKEIARNTSVISLEYEELQVDLIWSAQHLIDYASSYFSFNDLGNLIGKTAHRFGLKHGHGGLTLPVRDGNHGLGEILLTADHDRALRFLGYDHETFNAGFDNLEEIFQFATSSNFFDPNAYAFENLNAVARIRDRKRSTYNSFLKYLETQTKEPKLIFPEDKSEHLETIFLNFPDVLPDYVALMQELAAQRYLKTRFNGEIVHSVTHLQGKELGELMKVLKREFRLQPHTLPIISDATVRDIIRACYNNFKQ